MYKAYLSRQVAHFLTTTPEGCGRREVSRVREALCSVASLGLVDRPWCCSNRDPDPTPDLAVHQHAGRRKPALVAPHGHAEPHGRGLRGGRLLPPVPHLPPLVARNRLDQRHRLDHQNHAPRDSGWPRCHRSRLVGQALRSGLLVLVGSIDHLLGRPPRYLPWQAPGRLLQGQKGQAEVGTFGQGKATRSVDRAGSRRTASRCLQTANLSL